VNDKEQALKRDIGFFGSAFLSFNGVVGAGIFALPALLYARFGDFSPWLFIRDDANWVCDSSILRRRTSSIPRTARRWTPRLQSASRRLREADHG